MHFLPCYKQKSVIYCHREKSTLLQYSIQHLYRVFTKLYQSCRSHFGCRNMWYISYSTRKNLLVRRGLSLPCRTGPLVSFCCSLSHQQTFRIHIFQNLLQKQNKGSDQLMSLTIVAWVWQISTQRCYRHGWHCWKRL